MPRVIHFEIPADQPEEVVRFYQRVFGWEIRKWEGPAEYWLVQTGSDGPGIDGGILRRQHPGQPVVNTIDVPSLDDYCSRVTAAGGTIVVPKMPIPGVGYLAYFKDPDGNISGMMEMDETAGDG